MIIISRADAYCASHCRFSCLNWFTLYRVTSFSAVGGPIWLKFRTLLQSDMFTAVIWSKSKPEVQFQYGATLQGSATRRIQWHVILDPRATLQGEWIPSAILKIVFRRILFFLFSECSLGFGERRLSYRLRYTCLKCYDLCIDYNSREKRFKLLLWNSRHDGNGTLLSIAGGSTIQ